MQYNKQHIQIVFSTQLCSHNARFVRRHPSNGWFKYDDHLIRWKNDEHYNEYVSIFSCEELVVEIWFFLAFTGKLDDENHSQLGDDMVVNDPSRHDELILFVGDVDMMMALLVEYRSR